MPEKGFNVSESWYLDILVIILARQWATFCKQPLAAMMPIVREFYCNAKEHNNGPIFVWGKFVPLTIDAIYTYFEIPKDVVGEDFTWELNYNEVHSYLCKVIGSVKYLRGCLYLLRVANFMVPTSVGYILLMLGCC